MIPTLKSASTAAPHAGLASAWRGQPASAAAPRSTTPGAAFWLAAGAAVSAAGLLLAFQQVVSEGALQGASRQRAVAAMADAAWRCAVPGADPAGADCLATMSAKP